MHNGTPGGYAPLLNYTQGEPTVISCFFVVSIRNRVITASHGAAYLCLSSLPSTSS
jgi:hypothetical protein